MNNETQLTVNVNIYCEEASDFTNRHVATTGANGDTEVDCIYLNIRLQCRINIALHLIMVVFTLCLDF